MSELNKQLISVLDAERQKKKLTWAALGSKCDLTPSQMSQIKNEYNPINLPALIKIAKALNTDVWRLIRKAEKEQSK